MHNSNQCQPLLRRDSYCVFELDGERYKVLAAEVVGDSGEPGITLDDRLAIACGASAIRPTLVQRAGKPAMETAALLRGKPIPAGTRLA